MNKFSFKRMLAGALAFSIAASMVTSYTVLAGEESSEPPSNVGGTASMEVNLVDGSGNSITQAALGQQVYVQVLAWGTPASTDLRDLLGGISMALSYDDGDTTNPTQISYDDSASVTGTWSDLCTCTVSNDESDIDGHANLTPDMLSIVVIDMQGKKSLPLAEKKPSATAQSNLMIPFKIGTDKSLIGKVLNLAKGKSGTDTFASMDSSEWTIENSTDNLWGKVNIIDNPVPATGISWNDGTTETTATGYMYGGIDTAAIGCPFDLQAKLSPDTATTGTVNWESSAPNEVKVEGGTDNKGQPKVTVTPMAATAAGKTVTVTGTLQVSNVNDPPKISANITVNSQSLEMKSEAGARILDLRTSNTLDLEAVLAPDWKENYNPDETTWSVTDTEGQSTDLATIASDTTPGVHGLKATLTGNGNKKTGKVKVRAVHGSLAAEADVLVAYSPGANDIKSVTIEDKYTQGETVIPNVEFSEYVSVKEVSYQSSDTNVLEVQLDGSIKAVGSGIAFITAISANGLASKKSNNTDVIPADAATISWENGEASMTKDLTIYGEKSNPQGCGSVDLRATTKTETGASANEKANWSITEGFDVITLDVNPSDGNDIRLIAKKAGTATLQGKILKGTFITCTVTVTQQTMTVEPDEDALPTMEDPNKPGEQIPYYDCTTQDGSLSMKTSFVPDYVKDINGEITWEIIGYGMITPDVTDPTKAVYQPEDNAITGEEITVKATAKGPIGMQKPFSNTFKFRLESTPKEGDFKLTTTSGAEQMKLGDTDTAELSWTATDLPSLTDVTFETFGDAVQLITTPSGDSVDFKAVKLGTGTIIAKNKYNPNITASVDIKVTGIKPLTGVDFDADKYSLEEGTTIDLHERLQFMPEDTDDVADIAYSIDETGLTENDIISIDPETGIVTGKSAGESQIRAVVESYMGDKYEATAVVEVTEKTSPVDPSGDESSSSSSNVKTGDVVPLAGFAALAGISACAILLKRRKK